MACAEATDDVSPALTSKSCGSSGTEGIPVRACDGFCLAQKCAAPGGTVAKTIRVANSRAGSMPSLEPRRSRSRVAVWWSLSTSASLLGTAGTAGYLHSTVGLALAEAEATTLLIAALTLLVIVLLVILRGSDEAREHLFRLLRWAGNRPEPPAPATTNYRKSGTKPGTPTPGHADGPVRATGMRTLLPVQKAPLPDGMITLRQWAQRVDRAPSTVITHWRQRPGFPSPVAQLPAASCHRGAAGESLYIETELEAWRMVQIRPGRSKREPSPYGRSQVRG